MPIFKLFFTTAFALLALTAQAQSPTAKSFFIPADSVNQSTFVSPGKDGEPSPVTTVIMYAKKDEGYEVLNKKTIESRMISMSSQYVQFANNEVMRTRIRTMNIIGLDLDKTHKVPQTLLKVPAPGQKAYWSTTEPGGDVFKCSAEMASVIINGKTIPAIKVIKQGYKDGGKTFVSWANTTEYYVQGTGLYKIKYKDGKTMEILNAQTLESFN